MPHMLTYGEVLHIHEALTNDFANASDPISPPGVKSDHLLQSAIARQQTGFGSKLKYETPVLNAAALTYGICCNHPFHNGNKRTGLVSMLCHLDKNDFTFNDDVAHDELYEFMIKVADHGFSEKGKKREQSDREVEQMAKWIRKRIRKIERGERIVTFRELKALLVTQGFEFEDVRDNSMDLVRYSEESIWLGLGKRTHRTRIMRMAYPGDGQVVGRTLLKEIRERCGLSESQGFDSHAFYAKIRPADYFVQKYRGTLRRLART